MRQASALVREGGTCIPARERKRDRETCQLRTTVRSFIASIGTVQEYVTHKQSVNTRLVVAFKLAIVTCHHRCRQKSNIHASLSISNHKEIVYITRCQKYYSTRELKTACGQVMPLCTLKVVKSFAVWQHRFDVDSNFLSYSAPSSSAQFRQKCNQFICWW